MNKRRLYFDYNATAPLRPEARAAMLDALDAVGNASSVHGEGRAARSRVEAARGDIACLVGGDPKLVTFTSGGTEANNTVLTPHWTRAGKPYRIERLLVGATEHPSVLAGGRFPVEKVQQIPVDREGVTDLDRFGEMLAANDEATLVSVMVANNETGVIQPIAEIAEITRAAGAIFHTDAVQAAGRIPIDMNTLGVDVLSLSAHKIGGPQGAGAIVRSNEDMVFSPLLAGGTQEMRLRAGTENVAAIAGFGAAAKMALANLEDVDRLAALRDEVAAVIADSGRQVAIFGPQTARLPQTLCVALAGTSAETLVIALDLAGISVSSGSACSSGKVGPSHVLAAMEVPSAIAQAAIRISLGWESTESDIDIFASAWRDVLKRIAPNENEAA